MCSYITRRVSGLLVTLRLPPHLHQADFPEDNQKLTESHRKDKFSLEYWDQSPGYGRADRGTP
jgi:hypothetical protein